MIEVTIRVSGLCEVQSADFLIQALSDQDAISSIKCDVEAGIITLWIEEEELEPKAICEMIRSVGYECELIPVGERE